MSNTIPIHSEHEADMTLPARVILMAMMIDRIEHMSEPEAGDISIGQMKEWHVLMDCLAALLPEYLRARQLLTLADDEETWKPTEREAAE